MTGYNGFQYLYFNSQNLSTQKHLQVKLLSPTPSVGYVSHPTT